MKIMTMILMTEPRYIETEINVDDYLSDDETPSYKLSANNYSADDEEKEIPYASGTSFNQYLITTIKHLSS